MKVIKYVSHALRTIAFGAPLVVLVACGGGGSVSPAPISAPRLVPLSYVKVCNNGENEGTGTCPKNAALGDKPEEWACTADTRTGLLWEVKRPGLGGIQNNPRSESYLYSNYDRTDKPQLFQTGSGGINGGYVNPTQSDIDAPRNALGFAKEVNEQTGADTLCGTRSWRLPAQTELESLLDLTVVSTPATSSSFAIIRAAINEKYFPNTNPSEPYTSSTPTTDPAFQRDLFTNNITFQTINKTVADQLKPWNRGFNFRAPVRLVADCKCKAVGDTQATRNFGRSLLLPDGTVLTVGGSWPFAASWTKFAEIFDPVTEQWSGSGQFTPAEAADLPGDRHSATLLGSKVIVVGGTSSVNGGGPGNNVWIYDTAIKSWTKGKNTYTMHKAHGAVAIGSNKLIVLGGDCDIGVATPCNSGSVEEYDVSNNTWTQKTPMPAPLHSASTTVLPDGRILMAGGNNNFIALNTVQIYDPVANTWTGGSRLGGVSNMNESRYYHTATLLKDGRVLVSGGNTVPGGMNTSAVTSKTAEIYDPATNLWAVVAPLSVERVLHTATLLADGRVLVAAGAGKGGSNTVANNVTATVEIYDPKTDKWAPACSLLNVRYSYNATLLAGGTRILISGGRGAAATLTSAEIYTP